MFQDIISYFVGRFFETLVPSLMLGLVVPLMFRPSRALSFISGILAAMTLPAAMIYTGHVTGGIEDYIVVIAIAAVLGAGLGWFVHAGYLRDKRA
jgi:hypothetical protein